MGMLSNAMNVNAEALVIARHEYAKLFSHIAGETGLDLRRMKFITTSEQIGTPAFLVSPDLNQPFEAPQDQDYAITLVLIGRGSTPGSYFKYDREFKHLWIKADKANGAFSVRVVDAPLKMQEEWKTGLDGKGLLLEIDSFIEKFARNELKGAIKRALPQAKVPVTGPGGTAPK